MGKSPDEIEREIARRREWLSQRIGSLQERVDDDINSMKSGVRDRAKGAANTTKDSVDVRSKVEEHPLTMVVGAFGVGVLLGVMSDSAGGAEDELHERRFGSNGRRDDGFLSEIAGSIMGFASSTVRDELRQVVRDSMSGLNGRREGPQVREQTPPVGAVHGSNGY